MADQITRAQAREIKTIPGFYLAPDAAIALDNANLDFGASLIITGALRTYQTQYDIFVDRYRPGWVAGADNRYWPGHGWYHRVKGAAAAVPGTSNHGAGRAVDVKTRREASDPPRSKGIVWTAWNDSDREAWLKKAAKYGWREDEGKRVGELWHVTYYPQYDQFRGQVLAAPGKGSGSRPTPSPLKLRPHVIHTIRPGDKDDWAVKLWQEFLIEQGLLAKGTADGDFGPKTKSATRKWQKRAGLDDDGVVGKKTWLRAVWGTNKGDRGARVKIAQRVLGLTGKKVDGVAGAEFDRRAKGLQRWLGFTGKEVDGSLGAASVKRLLAKTA